MSKELEKDFMNDIMGECVLTVKPKDIGMLLYDIYDVPSSICESLKSLIERLEAIENSNPSDAMECFKRVWNDINAHNDYRQDFKDLRIIENYILKSQIQEKALKIIKEKYVHIPQLLCAFENQLELKNPLENYYNGQVGINVPMPLTEEEFNLLKEYFKC